MSTFFNTSKLLIKYFLILQNVTINWHILFILCIYFLLFLESLFENPQKPASIFEQDNNNSFFSSNFSKLTNGKTSPGKFNYYY